MKIKSSFFNCSYIIHVCEQEVMTTSMHRRKRPMISAALCALLSGLLLLSGCGKGPEAGTVYGPADSEENLYLDLTAEERATIHGNNERIRLETAHSAVEFFIRLMQKC